MDGEPFPLPTMAGQVDQSPQRKVAPLTIALDFDLTYTADPDLWRNFMGYAKRQGHKVICVTARHYTPENKAELKAALPPGVLIYFTEHGSKMEYMAKQGVIPNIWIDDKPEVVVNGV